MALSANSDIKREVGDLGSVPAAASSTLYRGAMVGEYGGYGRALTAGDKFLGHNIGPKLVNVSDGDNYIDVPAGRYRLQVTLSGVEITDIGCPVYATDDATLSLVGANATGANSFVGVVHRYVSTDLCVVEFRPGEVDEFGENQNRILKADNYTVLTTDSGKIVYIATDAKVFTLPATEMGLMVTIVNAGGDGDVLVSIDPNASDLILGGCGLAAGGDGKKANNTKATAKRGDYITLLGDGTAASGWRIIGKRGVWAMES